MDTERPIINQNQIISSGILRRGSPQTDLSDRCLFIHFTDFLINRTKNKKSDRADRSIGEMSQSLWHLCDGNAAAGTSLILIVNLYSLYINKKMLFERHASIFKNNQFLIKKKKKNT